MSTQCARTLPLLCPSFAEFVGLYTQWLLNGSIKRQFAEFKRGFDLVTANSSIEAIIALVSAWLVAPLAHHLIICPFLMLL